MGRGVEVSAGGLVLVGGTLVAVGTGDVAAVGRAWGVAVDGVGGTAVGGVATRVASGVISILAAGGKAVLEPEAGRPAAGLDSSCAAARTTAGSSGSRRIASASAE